jgi:hypothetical protein
MGIPIAALSNKHVRDIKKLVDEHAAKGELTKSLLKDIENSLSFSPTSQEVDFLERYIAWRLDHGVAGVSQP